MSCMVIMYQSAVQRITMFTIEHRKMCELYNAMSITLKAYKSVATRNDFKAPDFTIEQFMSWCYQQPDFDEVMKIWAFNHFNKEYRPKMKVIMMKVDRYQLKNLRFSSHHVLEMEYEKNKPKEF